MLLLLLLPAVLFSQTIDSAKLDHYFKGIENDNLGIGSLSVFKGGREVYHIDFGQRNLADLKFDKDTKYQVGSVTKLVTATLILRLVEQGRLTLDDRLATYYPQIPNAGKITIKNLLEHTSGLGSYVVKDGEVWVTDKLTEGAIMDLIVKQGASFEPGEKVAYSNSAYYLLAKILEQKYKLPYHHIIKREIAGPLGLTHLASVKSRPKNLFKPYRFENGTWREMKDLDFLNVIGVGDLVSTPKELNIFIENLFGGKIISQESLDLMLPVLGKETWGRGIALWEFDGVDFLGHGGDTLGSHAVLVHNDADDISISYNTNGERIKKEEIIKNIVHLIYGKPFQLPVIK